MVRRLLPIVAAVVVLAAASAGYLAHTRSQVSDAPAIGGPFRLTAQDGTILDSRDLAGKPYAVFFGFTHCPEVCPTTLSEVSRVFQDLGAEAHDLSALFITVDPERDTPQVLNDYVSSFSGRITGLSGTPQEIADVARKFKVYYQKVSTSDGGYTMSHTAVIYLMDRHGGFQDALSYDADHQQMIEKFRALLASG